MTAAQGGHALILPGLSADGVRYDPAAQVNMRVRRALAKELVQLLGASHITNPSIREQVEWELGRALQSAMKAMERQNQGRPTLVGTIDAAEGKVQERLSDLVEEENIGAARARLVKAKAWFDCPACSVHDGCCRNSPRDLHFFVDGERGGEARRGGLCVDYVRRIVEWSLTFTRKFASMTGIPIPGGGAEILVKMYQNDTTATSTLSINGRMDLLSQPPVLEIIWPTRMQDYSEALLQLPYLVFHEIFVHGTQGYLLETPPPELPDSCAFTEGLVDAVACDMLKKYLSAPRPDFPTELKDLRGRYKGEVARYDTAMEADPRRGEEQPIPERIHRARKKGRDVYAGLSSVFEEFEGEMQALGIRRSLEKHGPFRLHLKLDEEDRKTLINLLAVTMAWEEREWCLAAVIALGLFEEDECETCLRYRLEFLCQQKRRWHRNPAAAYASDGWLEMLRREQCGKHETGILGIV